MLRQETAKKRLEVLRQKSLQRRNKRRKPHEYHPNQFVLVHKSRFPNRRFLKVESPWLGPFKILDTTPTTVTVLTSPTLGGVLQVSTSLCKSWKSIVESSESDEDTSDSQDQAVSSTLLVQESFPKISQNFQNLNQFQVRKIHQMKFKAGWKYLTQWKGFPMSQATWEPLSTFIIPSPSCSVVHPAFKDFSKGKPHLFQLSERFCRRQASSVVEHLSETTPVQVDWTPLSGKPASESPKEEGIY